MEFEWDGQKAAKNLSKHGVTFGEAKTILMIRSILTFMIPIILMKRSVILSSENHDVVVC